MNDWRDISRVTNVTPYKCNCCTWTRSKWTLWLFAVVVNSMMLGALLGAVLERK